MIPGFATKEGTRRYVERLGGEVDTAAYRRFKGRRVSSIAIGTLRGEPSAEDDENYYGAIRLALSSGCNVIDSAPCYRESHSEKTIGSVLVDCISEGIISRDEVLITSAAGFGTSPDIAQYLFPKGILAGDVMKIDHSLDPMFIIDSLDASRERLGVETIDVFYLHHPEIQLVGMAPGEFYEKLEVTFAALEQAVADGKIVDYGVTSYDGFRQEVGSPGVIELEKLLAVAQKVGGDEHSFRAIQLPLNLANTRVVSVKSQPVRRLNEKVPILRAAPELGIFVFGSSPLDGGRLNCKLPALLNKCFPHLNDDVLRAIEFNRACAGVGCAIVGMRTTEHVRHNLQLLNLPPTPGENFSRLFSRTVADSVIQS